MNGEQCLKRVDELHNMIQLKRERLEGMRDIASKVSVRYDGERVSGSGNQQAMETAIVRMLAYEEEILLLNAEILELQNEISCVLDHMKNDRRNMVLTKRYIKFQSWNEIADEMNISVRRVKQIHEAAYHAFNACYDQVIKCGGTEDE